MFSGYSDLGISVNGSGEGGNPQHPLGVVHTLTSCFRQFGIVVEKAWQALPPCVCTV